VINFTTLENKLGLKASRRSGKDDALKTAIRLRETLKSVSAISPLRRRERESDRLAKKKIRDGGRREYIRKMGEKMR